MQNIPHKIQQLFLPVQNIPYKIQQLFFPQIKLQASQNRCGLSMDTNYPPPEGMDIKNGSDMETSTN